MEINIHRQLQHPNTVHLQDTFEDSKNIYILLQLCSLGSLKDLLDHRGCFNEPEVRSWFVQLAGAVHYLHDHQLVHRDIKPGNMLLDCDMNLKLGDFG
ncbi:kinase-like domain-containing protein [Crepidotus variabilis]|uniref:Kinase-like domain-containing protein n=1 Tax=Crepidotus variabilis TaxID=179855 RepID=A0A9P6JJF2_9AGAR|nr:kinase-like domain-containing protein [Crepidotus variabilis]